MYPWVMYTYIHIRRYSMDTRRCSINKRTCSMDIRSCSIFRISWYVSIWLMYTYIHIRRYSMDTRRCSINMRTYSMDMRTCSILRISWYVSICMDMSYVYIEISGDILWIREDVLYTSEHVLWIWEHILWIWEHTLCHEYPDMYGYELCIHIYIRRFSMDTKRCSVDMRTYSMDMGTYSIFWYVSIWVVYTHTYHEIFSIRYEWEHVLCHYYSSTKMYTVVDCISLLQINPKILLIGYLTNIEYFRSDIS